MNFLTMNIYVNAWLDCRNPYITIHNKRDGDLMAFFNSEKVNELIETGEVSIADFESLNESETEELISTLLTINFADSIKDEIKKRSESMTTRQANYPANDFLCI